MIVENAIIKNVSLGVEDHGCLTLNLTLGMESNGVTFGGISMGSFKPEANLSESSHGNYAAYYITKVLDTVGVDEVSQLKGRPVRVIFDGDSLWGGNCIGIQNFIDTSKFFIPHMIDPEYKPDLSAILSDIGKYVYEEKLREKEVITSKGYDTQGVISTCGDQLAAMMECGNMTVEPFMIGGKIVSFDVVQ